jgi:hypothetical protein
MQANRPAPTTQKWKKVYEVWLYLSTTPQKMDIMKNLIAVGLLLIGLSTLPPLAHATPEWYDPEDLEQAFLGVRSNEITKQKAEKLGFDNPHGSYVTSVIQNTAADKAGIQPFDYIYAVNDQETNSSRDLGDLLSKYEAGQQVIISLIRKKKTMRVEVILSSRNDAVFEPRNPDEKPFLGVIDSYDRANSRKPKGFRYRYPLTRPPKPLACKMAM